MSEVVQIIRFGRVKGDPVLSYVGGERPPGLPWAEVTTWVQAEKGSTDPRITLLEGKDGAWILQSVSYPLAEDSEELNSFTTSPSGRERSKAMSYFDIPVDPRMEILTDTEFDAAVAKWDEMFSDEAVIKRMVDEEEKKG